MQEEIRKIGAFTVKEALDRCAGCPALLPGGWCREESSINDEDKCGNPLPRRFVAILDVIACPKGKTLKGEK